MPGANRAPTLIASLAVGYGPGFLLPFAVAAAVPQQDSDRILLAIAVAVATGAILAVPYENAWAAHVGLRLADNGSISQKELLAGLRQAALVGTCASVLAFPLFCLPFLLTADPEGGSLGLSLASVAAVPVITAVASVSDGVLNAQGRVAVTIALRGTRGVFPLLGVVAAALGSDVAVIGLLLTVGEICRAALVFLLARSRLSTSSAAAEIPRARAVLHHVVGLAALGSSPVIDQWFFARETGAVTRFAMADRVFTAGSQLCANLLVLPRVPAVARRLAREGLPTTVRGEVTRILRRTGMGTVAAGLAIGGYVGVIGMPADRELVLWTLILLVSLPAEVSGIVVTRLMVAAGRGRLIPFTAMTGLAMNIAGNVIGYLALGAVGVVISTVVWRYLLLAISIALLVRSFPGKVPATRAPALTQGPPT